MKVLLVHNFYRSSAPSGEDVVFRNERALLERNGIEVVSYERHNDDIDERSVAGRIATAAGTTWSMRSYRELRALIRSERPDVAHFHNTFPLVSPAAYVACRRLGIPVVQTLHNFRLLCASGLLYREGRPCEDCVGTSLWPALRYRCYRDSLAATTAVVGMLSAHRAIGTYSRDVDRYIALTEFAASVFERAGWPREKIVVKPNFFAGVPSHAAERGGYALYTGRLAAEKGVRTLLDAWRGLRDVELRIAGDGPLRSELERKAAAEGLPVRFLGYRPSGEVAELVSRARFQVVPSEWYEGFPMVVVEAFVHGTPVLASRIGALAEIVREGSTGMLFEPGRAEDLCAKARALADPAVSDALGRGALKEYAGRYTPERNFAELMAIYGALVHGAPGADDGEGEADRRRARAATPALREER
jgi:glycosyltransferase involved in cell wall biosynthesis